MTKKKPKVEVVETKEVAQVPKQTVEIAMNEPKPFKIDPEMLIMKAMEKEVSVDIIERFLGVRATLKAEYAKEQFDNAMADFQMECPVIKKTKTARDEEKNKNLYRYAPIEDIIEQTKEIISRHGFSYSFLTENSPTNVKVTCIVKHRDGHSEQSHMETALATKTNIMSQPQQIAATVTFNKRYAFLNAFGITTGGEDSESTMRTAGESVAAGITAEQVEKLQAMLRTTQRNEKKVLARFKVGSLEELNARDALILEKSLEEIIRKEGNIPVIQQ